LIDVLRPTDKAAVLGAAQVLMEAREIADLQTDVYDALSEQDGWEGRSVTMPINQLLCVVPRTFCTIAPHLLLLVSLLPCSSFCTSAGHCSSLAVLAVAVAVDIVPSSKSTQHRFVLGHKATTINLSLFADNHETVIKYITDHTHIPLFLSGCSVWRNEAGKVKSLNLGSKTAILRPVLSAAVKVDNMPCIHALQFFALSCLCVSPLSSI
jgi:hypothetical protein